VIRSSWQSGLGGILPPHVPGIASSSCSAHNKNDQLFIRIFVTVFL
jgi:hypothetical protein